MLTVYSPSCQAEVISVKISSGSSNTVDIGLSIVHGYGIRPALYVIMKSDLPTLSEINDLQMTPHS